LPVENERVMKVEEKIQSLRRGSFKTSFYVVALVVSLSLLNFLFGWTSAEAIPSSLQFFSDIILLVNPYLPYIQAVLIFALGYLVVNALSGMTYTYMRRITDHPTAATIRTMTRISGLAVLLSIMTSVFNVNAAAALTIGSFGGLVVGFATQTILSHVVAGVFLLISRPYTFGDIITVAGQTGVVKEVKLMHLVLEATDETREILIPSGTVVTQIIQKMRPPAQHKPIKTSLILDTLPRTIPIGLPVTFTGRLVETGTGKPVSGVNIRILDSDIGGDDLLASGTTENEGRFSITWTARKTDPHDNTAEAYAKFEGNDDYQQSKSKQFVIEIK
jgi:5-hydroxyisourate hydrolase-like protein (transthyretin family)